MRWISSGSRVFVNASRKRILAFCALRLSPAITPSSCCRDDRIICPAPLRLVATTIIPISLASRRASPLNLGAFRMASPPSPPPAPPPARTMP